MKSMRRKFPVGEAFTVPAQVDGKDNETKSGGTIVSRMDGGKVFLTFSTEEGLPQ